MTTMVRGMLATVIVGGFVSMATSWADSVPPPALPTIPAGDLCVEEPPGGAGGLHERQSAELALQLP
jgi:hypothetical protein